MKSKLSYRNLMATSTEDTHRSTSFLILHVLRSTDLFALQFLASNLKFVPEFRHPFDGVVERQAGGHPIVLSAPQLPNHEERLAVLFFVLHLNATRYVYRTKAIREEKIKHLVSVSNRFKEKQVTDFWLDLNLSTKSS